MGRHVKSNMAHATVRRGELSGKNLSFLVYPVIKSHDPDGMKHVDFFSDMATAVSAKYTLSNLSLPVVEH